MAMSILSPDSADFIHNRAAPLPVVARLSILGSRGIPAAHGGFETFAERLALHLVARGWEVNVACHAEGPGPHPAAWRGVNLSHYSPLTGGALGTMETDFRATVAALRRSDLVLTLGYNTAIFGLLARAASIPHLMNMDGIEWRRDKWSRPVKAWFWFNERIARFATDRMIADHPAIAAHLSRHTPAERITVIPYGADAVVAADPAPLARLGLAGKRFATFIARPEPENTLLEIVSAFSQKPRGVDLVVLGRLGQNSYHDAVRAAASAEIRFADAIYDPAILRALRGHTVLHVHGHRVGGTNPSLVEALGAGNPILAHDNPFNRWVAGPAMSYFSDTQHCAEAFSRLLAPDADLTPLAAAARARHAEAFTWPSVLEAYEQLLLRWVPTVSRGIKPAPRSMPATD
jgi:glycosyltransferase involved in cell wall biosynthesis